MGREDLPVIPEANLQALVAMEKPVPDWDWRDQLAPKAASGGYRRGLYVLPHPVENGPYRGTFRLTTRETVADPDNFSVILNFSDYAENKYNLVRCNGYHGAHDNRIEGDHIPAATPHVHFATERCLRHRRAKHDNYAVPTADYADLKSAVEHLATLANLVPDGRLYL